MTPGMYEECDTARAPLAIEMRDRVTLTPPLLPDQPRIVGWPMLAGVMSRRELYLLGLPLGALSLMPTWLDGSLDVFERVAIPAVWVLMIGVFVALLLGRWPLERLLWVLLGGLWLWVLGRVGFVLFDPQQAPAGALAACGPWVPVLLTGHLWMLGRDAGRLASQIALGALVLLLLTAGLRDPGLTTSHTGNLLVQMLLASLAALAGQRSGVARLRRELRVQRLGTDLTGLGDSLTGLLDGRATRRWLRQASPRQLEGLAVAVIEVDQHRQLEATRGEAFAGCLMAHVARVLEGALRDADTLTRLGPSEFAALVRVPDERAARATCERLRLRVASRPLDGVNVSVSVGVAVYSSEQDGLALLAGAQDALDDLRAGSGNRAKLAVQRPGLPTDVPADVS